MPTWSRLPDEELGSGLAHEPPSPCRRGQALLTLCYVAAAFCCGIVATHFSWPHVSASKGVDDVVGLQEGTWASDAHCQSHCRGRGAEVKPWAPGLNMLRNEIASLKDDNEALRKQVDMLKQAHGGLDDVAKEAQSQQHGSWLLSKPTAPKYPSSRKWAFVTLAYDAPGQMKYLWEVLPIARALQRVSSYPLIVLTNSTHFPDGTLVATALKNLNAQVMPVYTVARRSGKRFAFSSWNVAFWKLQIWKLTQFEKLIWLDSDSIIYRSIDWLFERPGMWAQRDDWFCKMGQPGVCSGIMLLYPNASDFEGLLEYDERHPNLDHGDQQLISDYFRIVRKAPINLLDDLEASFGQCLGKAKSPYRNSDGSGVHGVWSTPSFVHKSGGWGDTDNNIYNNVCFQHNVTRQYYSVGGLVLNICHYHPLGAYWRNLFCEAAGIIQLHTIGHINTFCSDECWYQGGESECRVVNSAVSYATVTSASPGLPALELEATLSSHVGAGGEMAE